MKVLDLFSGIGGFSLGLERTGMTTVAFCEIDPFCKRVLAKHWPEVPIYDDIRTLTADRLADDGIDVDLICGGFPCQNISIAGRREGIEGKESGLWSEFARLIGEIRPKYAIVENVAALRSRGLDRVLGDLAALRYDARWDCIPAAAIGAPHLRDRIWITAYPQHSHPHRNRPHRAQEHLNGGSQLRDQQISEPGPLRQDVADTGRVGGATGREAGHMAGTPRNTESEENQRQRSRDAADHRGSAVADTYGRRQQGIGIEEHNDEQGPPGHQPDRRGAWGWRNGASDMAHSVVTVGWGSARVRRGSEGEGENPPECRRRYCSKDVQWLAEPDVGRVADGVSNRVHRLRSLGNSLVPQIPEILGRAIMSLEDV